MADVNGSGCCQGKNDVTNQWEFHVNTQQEEEDGVVGCAVIG